MGSSVMWLSIPTGATACVDAFAGLKMLNLGSIAGMQ